MKPGAARRPLVVVIVLLASLLVVLILGPAILAQNGAGYDLSWSAIVGGGTTHVAGGNYVLGSSVGQAGVGKVRGGHYQLDGGFWHCFSPDAEACQGSAGSMIFIPVVTNQDQ